MAVNVVINSQASANRGKGSSVPGRSLSLIPKAFQGKEKKNDNRVIINVGGIRYETYKSTLKNIPDTRLSWLTETPEQNADFDQETGEYFFDRHPGVFLMVLNYYRTGRLHVPTDVCGPLFEEELAFWGIDEKQIEPCCWGAYRTHRDAQETLKELEGKDPLEDSDDEESGAQIAERFGILEETGPSRNCWERIQPRMWSLLEEPNSSKGAQVVAIISVLFVVLSITTFCMETHIAFRVPINESIPLDPKWTRMEKSKYSKPHLAIEIIDYVCIAYFTLELLIRIIFAPSKLAFFRVALNWVDLLAVLPFYLEKLIVSFDPSFQNSPSLQVLKSLKLMRIFRIFKLTRHFSGLKILAHSIKASAKELVLLILFLLITVLIFACVIYYAESMDEHELNDFKNIPVGFWWAVVTMTTLGYGDIYPRTGLGYVVGGLCAVAGVLVLALPVPVIVNNFALYYSHAQARLKLPKKRKRVLVGAADQLKTQVNLPGIMESAPTPTPGSRSSTPDSAGSDVSDRKGSNDSMEASDDSGIKTARGSGEGGGISVIFTDELTDSPSRCYPLPPLVERETGCNGSVSARNKDYLQINQNTEVPLAQIGENKRGRSNSSISSQPPRGPPPRRRSLFPQAHAVADVEV